MLSVNVAICKVLDPAYYSEWLLLRQTLEYHKFKHCLLMTWNLQQIGLVSFISACPVKPINWLVARSRAGTAHCVHGALCTRHRQGASFFAHYEETGRAACDVSGERMPLSAPQHRHRYNRQATRSNCSLHKL